MASLGYIAVPPSATRLQSPPPASSPLQRAKKVVTSLPTPTPPPPTAPSDVSSPPNLPLTSPTSVAFAVLPQILSSTLPGPTIPGGPKDAKEKDARKGGPQLLTTKEPLSIPITTANFKRFVAKSGPVFWMQDRIEEVILWKRGWKVTIVWMAVYAFFCYFPKMVFAIPHMALIAVMLALYPYSTTSKPGEAPSSSSDSVNWQGNLQAIQNLMGFVADTYDLIQPHTHLLLLTPAHIPINTSIETPPPNPNISPYPPLIFLTLLLTFPPLVLILSSPYFPTRIVCLVGGLAPLVATHPRVKPLLVPLAKLGMTVAESTLVVLVMRYSDLRKNISRWKLSPGASQKTSTSQGDESRTTKEILPPLQTILERIRDNDRLDDTCWNAEMREVELWENERYAPSPSSRSRHTMPPTTAHLPAYPDGTSDDANAHMVYSPTYSSLPPDSPFNRKGGSRFSLPPISPLPTPTSIQSTAPDPSDSGWGKGNLKGGERRAWTRGQDGWGGIVRRTVSVGSGAGGDEDEASGHALRPESVDSGEEGVVSSNLTFSLGAGWNFVQTEGWRKDRSRRWAGNEIPPDSDGWVYTNDTWSCAQGTPYPGSVTRRRRWVRRVWFDGTASGAQDSW